MPQLNRRTLAISVVSVALLAVAIFGLHWFQVGRHSSFFADQADREYALGNYREAAGMYRQTLQMDPQSVPVLMGLARCLEELGDPQGAYTFAQRVERIEPTNAENQLRLARVNLDLRRYADAINRLQKLIAKAEAGATTLTTTTDESTTDGVPGDVDDVPGDVAVADGQTEADLIARLAKLYTLLATARAGDRDIDAAIGDYRTAIDTGAADVEAYAGLAELLIQKDDFAAAGETLDQLVQQHGEDSEAWIARGRFLLTRAQAPPPSPAVAGGATDSANQSSMPVALDRARSDAATARRLAQNDPPARVEATALAATIEFQAGNAEAAMELIRRELEQSPDASKLYQVGYQTLQAQAEIEAVDPAAGNEMADRATGLLQSGNQRLPGDPALLWLLANDHLQRGRPDAAAAATDQLDALGYAAPMVRYLRGRMLALRGDVNAAVALLTKVRSEVIENTTITRLVDLTLAGLYEKMGDLDSQVAAMRRVVAVDPFWLPGRERLSFALLRAGRVDEAVQEYQTVANRPDVPVRAPLNFAQLLLLQNLGRPEDRRDWDQLERLLDAVEEQSSMQTDVALLRAEMFVARDRVEQAREVLAEADQGVRIVSGRVLLEIAQGQSEAAAELAERGRPEFGDTPEYRYALAALASASTSEPIEPRLRQLSDIPSDWTAEQSIQLARSMVPLLISTKVYDTAETLARRGAELDPASVDFRLQLMQIAFETGSDARLRDQLDSLEKIAGRNARWYYGMALATAMPATDAVAGKLQSGQANGPGGARSSTPPPVDEDVNRRVQEYLAEAAVLRPDWALVPSFSAYLHDRAGNVETAIIKYNQAVELGWRDPSSIRRLISLLTKAERFGEADAVIRRLRGGNQPFTSELARIASEVSVELADMRRAAQLAAEAAEASGSVEDYLWLGQLSELIQDSDAAESAYRRAIEIQPDVARPTLAWIGFLERQQRLGEAREALGQFESTLDPSDTSSMLLLVEAYQGIGSDEEANRVISRIDSAQLSTLTEYQRFDRVLRLTGGQAAAVEQLRSWLAQSQDSSAEATSSATAETVRWARRQLALDLAGTAQPDAYREARSLIEANLAAKTADAQASFDDRRGSAIIDAIFLGVTQPEVAMKQFQSLLDDGWSPSIADEFIIGQLSSLSGDWTAGRRLMLPLLSNDELRRPDHIKTYVRLLLQQGDAAEAELWLDRLQSSGVRDRDTAVLTAQVLLRRSRYDRLVDLLTTAPQDVNVGDSQARWFATTLSYPDRFKLLTSLTSDLAKQSDENREARPAASGTSAAPQSAANRDAIEKLTAAADQMGEQLQQTGEFPGTYYAMQMLRRGDCRSALLSINNVIKTASEAELVEFAEAALSAPACSDVYQAMEKVYRQLAGVDAENIVYTVVLARIREVRGDYESATRAYEAILRRDPNHFAAANNLATILALRGTDPLRASDLINRLIDSAGQSLVTLDTRAVCRMSAGDYPSADEDLELAMQQFPHPVVQFHQAQSLLAQNQRAAAKTKFSGAIRSGLQRGDVHPLEVDTFDQLANL